MAVSVIPLALARFAQDLVGLLHFLELDLGFGVVGIAVRMVLQDQLTVCGLDGPIIRSARNTQNFVVTTLRGHRTGAPETRHASCGLGVTPHAVETEKPSRVPASGSGKA